MTLIIKNARIINASGETPGLKDILIEEGKIIRIGQNLAQADARVIDAAGKTMTLRTTGFDHFGA